MFQPEALTKSEKLFWSTGSGTDVWNLFCAAKDGDLETVKSLLEKDPSLIRAEYDYRPAISFAVREDQSAVVAFLLDKGASPVSSGNSDTLLQIAEDRGYLEIVQLLKNVITASRDSINGETMAETIRNRDIQKLKASLKESPGLSTAVDHTSNQPIHWAVMTRQPAMIDELLGKGADINAQRLDGARPIQLTNGDYGYRGWRDVPGDTTASPDDIFKHLLSRGAYLDICMAALKGYTERVRELLDEDPSLVNRVSDYVSYYAGSGAPIKNAALAGHIDIVRLLLERGADPNLPEEGIAPQGHALHSAVVSGHRGIVKLLLEYGAYPSVSIESSADTLSAAISNNDKEMIELLCSYGASRPVHLLAYYGDILTAAAVFKADPALANDPKALENAASEGHTSFVRLMLHYHPTLATRISVGVTSRAPQRSIKSLELTEFLFEKGMNPNLPHWLGITPLHRFAQRGDVDNAAVFIKYGADINAVDEEFHSTPLGYAAKHGKENMVEFLLEHGADPALPHDRYWARPIEWATRRGYLEIINKLKLNN